MTESNSDIHAILEKEEETIALLAAQLVEMTDPNTTDDRMDVLLDELTIESPADDEASEAVALFLVREKKAVRVLVNLFEKAVSTCNFYHKVVGCLIHMANDTAVANEVFDIGGFDKLFELFETLLYDEFLQTSLLAVLGALTTLDGEKRLQIIPHAYECTTRALEHHKTFLGCYEMACHVLLACGPPAGVQPSVIKRAADCIFRGIVYFVQEEDAQRLGRRLLHNLFEKESAEKLIELAELYHCEGGCEEDTRSSMLVVD